MTREPFSVALATFNGSRHLAAQLTSIFDQTVPVAEIVLADDGSRDGTVDLARRVFAERVGASIPELRIVAETASGGVARNFERALQATRHPLIALCDQDDIWHPDRIEAAAHLHATRPEILLVHANARLVNRDAEQLGSLFDALEISPAMLVAIHAGAEFELLLKRNVVTGATTTLRRELLDLAGTIPTGWLHDEWLGIVAAAHGRSDVIERPLIDYRQHEGNEVGARRLGIAGKFRRMLEPGRDRNARLLTRATSLSERFAVGGESLPPHRLAAVERKLRHEEVRSAFPVSRPHRLTAVIRELRTGRYEEFGRGRLDALRDVLQPTDR